MEMSYCRSYFEVNDVDSKPLDVDWLALNDLGDFALRLQVSVQRE